MRGCPQCFQAASWVANASPPDSAGAVCDFCHMFSTRTFLTSAWIDSFGRLLELYEVAEEAHASTLPVQLQEDWRIFTFNDPNRILQFIASSGLEGHDLLEPGARVRLRRSAESGADHIASWTQFSNEIRTENRYFPKTVPDREILERALTQSVVTLPTDGALYRARLTDTPTALASSKMGAPPAHSATEGRANPVGIPYLYVAFDRDTCIYELRPTAHSLISVGIFDLTREVRVLNLAEIPPLDFFDVGEIEDVSEQAQRISFHRYLVTLGHELSRPVRGSDRKTDYIPTQYLCELAKSVPLDGVMYASSVHAGGRNLVLFDVSIANCRAAVELVSVTELSATWKNVASSPDPSAGPPAT